IPVQEANAEEPEREIPSNRFTELTWQTLSTLTAENAEALALYLQEQVEQIRGLCGRIRTARRAEREQARTQLMELLLELDPTARDRLLQEGKDVEEAAEFARRGTSS